MIDKQINGYLYNHTKDHFLEIYIFNNLSHVIADFKNLMKDNDLHISYEKKNDAINLIRFYIHYDNYEIIKSLYAELNDRLKIKNIQYYATIKIIRTLLKYSFL